VAQIDPVTGAILATSPGLNDLDGLVYDPYSGLLYATSYLGNTIYSIDPNNLSNVQNLLGGTGTGGLPSPDGITTDGIGDLFIASSEYGGDSHIYQYNLVTHVLTQETYVNGLDDLAPASGLGALPEPSGLVLVGAGAIGLLSYAWRKRRQEG
jgi:DNA-binding beta-propeller fold protein YncE